MKENRDYSDVESSPYALTSNPYYSAYLPRPYNPSRPIGLAYHISVQYHLYNRTSARISKQTYEIPFWISIP